MDPGAPYCLTDRLRVLIMCRRYGLYLRNYFGSGRGQIWLEYLQCTGHEDSLVNCTHNGWGVHTCIHNDDVSILCGNGT